MTWWVDPIDTSHETELWRSSGALALSGPQDGPELAPPGAPASLMDAALRALQRLTAAPIPGVELLSERAMLSGLSRRGPWSVGGAFRALPTRDGWFGLSLARPSDLDLLPALLEGPVTDPWTDLAIWLRERTCAEAQTRSILLGLPGACVPRGPAPQSRAPVIVKHGGLRRTVGEPLVVDFSSLWAGPLCARLLSILGARVIKVEHSGRPDGARQGKPTFYARLHDGHKSIVLDFNAPADRRRLLELVSSADVVLEASRPRALEQLSLSASELVDNGTIWASITAYGRTGDSGQRVGFGDDVAAGAGLVGWHDGTPHPVGDALADPLTGAFAAATVAQALALDTASLLDLSMHDISAFAANLGA